MPSSDLYMVAAVGLVGQNQSQVMAKNTPHGGRPQYMLPRYYSTEYIYIFQPSQVRHAQVEINSTWGIELKPSSLVRNTHEYSLGNHSVIEPLYLLHIQRRKWPGAGVAVHSSSSSEAWIRLTGCSKPKKIEKKKVEPIDHGATRTRNLQSRNLTPYH